MNLVKNDTTKEFVGRCVNWYNMTILTDSVVLILGIYLKETINDIDNDLMIRTVFKFSKIEHNLNS